MKQKQQTLEHNYQSKETQLAGSRSVGYSLKGHSHEDFADFWSKLC